MAEAIAPVPAKRTKTWLIILGGLALLIVIAGLAALLLIHNRQLASEDADAALAAYASADADHATAAPAEPATPASAAGQHEFVTFDTFTANLAESDRDRFAQIGVVIEVGDLKAAGALKAVAPVIRSEVLMLLTSKTADDLLTLRGKQALAGQIVDIARKHIAADYRRSVYAAHFSSFVIQ